MQAGATTVEAYVSRSDSTANRNLKPTLKELAGLVEFYGKLFVPLETGVLRVSSIPLPHGRGFDGVILLSQRSGFSTADSKADLFRAHEVAHQWWGNLVQPLEYPRDRWISESFADFSAMEYYAQRFGKPGRTRTQIYEEWIRPVLETSQIAWKNLVGDKFKAPHGKRFPVVDGQQNVYTKGPAVLHMLRYNFRVTTGDDEAFWAMLRDFLERYRDQEVGTESFLALAEEHLGEDLDWFWDQWLFGTELPAVRWSQRVEKQDGSWNLIVEAEQIGTEFRLLIPVRVEFPGGRSESHPLRIDGSAGALRASFPEKPRKVTLNDGWEALVSIRN